MVVFSDEQVGLMVEDICGEAVRAHFEDAECGPDPMHPSDIDIECSSIEDVDSSDDDEIKELFAEQVLPAKARVRDVESVAIVEDSTPPAVSQVKDNRCAAGKLCGMKTTPLTIGGQVCLVCHKNVHGCICASLWAERGDGCQVTLEDLSWSVQIMTHEGLNAPNLAARQHAAHRGRLRLHPRGIETLPPSTRPWRSVR